MEVDNQFRAVHSGSLPLHALIGPALARALRLGAYLSVAVEHPAVAHGRDAVLEEVVAQHGRYGDVTAPLPALGSEPDFTDGEDVWIGVDVGGERSATAVIWVNAALHVGAAIYHGDPGVLEAVDHVRALAGRFNVRELVYDPWRFGQAAQELEHEGMLVVAFPQHDARMIPASARLHAAIVEQRITLPEHAELARHAADAIARHSRRGWRIDKPNPRANIDAVIALAMAVERAEHKPEPVELLGWL